ncbi:MAG: T9SS type A sorting domain-containing protein [Bacteroidales bacterium]|jgi:hypothetical protein|nr:T9SS type A sorting domain-containing protein [Bacteroidales bacterium]
MIKLKKIIMAILLIALIIKGGYAQQVASSFSGGDGLTESTAYQINTPQELRYLSKLLKEGKTSYNSKYYKLTSDIDFTSLSDEDNYIYDWSGGYNSSTNSVNGADAKKESNFLPIGGWSADITNATDDAHSFQGHFDGCGYKIIGMLIKKPTGGANNVGLFGLTKDAKIKNLTLEDCEFSANQYISCLIGRTTETGNDTITNCHIVNCTLHCNTHGGCFIGYNPIPINNSSRKYIKNCSLEKAFITSIGSYIGGFVGYNGRCNIDSSYCYNIEMTSQGGSCFGGMVGYSANGADIKNCYITNSKLLPALGNDAIGGLVGENYNWSYVENCYANNVYIDSHHMYTGGLIGRNHEYGRIRNSYITNSIIKSNNERTGGLIGYNYDNCSVDSCYAIYTDIVTTNTLYSAGLIGYNNNYCNVTDCFAAHINVNGRDWCGGLIGWSDQNNTVTRCYASYCNVTGNDDVGGLIGDRGDQNTSHVKECFSIYCNVNARTYVGGLIGGGNEGATISDCYSTLSNVKGSGDYIGGLLGWAGTVNVKNCYTNNRVQRTGSTNNVGGLIGMHSDKNRVTNSYYINTWRGSESYTQTNEAKTGSAKTASQMLDSAFVDILNNGRTGDDAVWFQDVPLYVNSGYPILSISVGNQGTTYQIWNIEDMRLLSQMVDDGEAFYNSYISLMADLDFDTAINITGLYTDNYKLRPIGSIQHPFCGSFDGNNYRIYNLKIKDVASDNVGLFGYIGTKAYIRNVALINCDMEGKQNVGSLVGFACPIDVKGSSPNVNGSANLHISKCFSRGNVTGIDNVGGFIGSASKYDLSSAVDKPTVEIENCYTRCDVFAPLGVNGNFIGNAIDINVTNAYATGKVATNSFISTYNLSNNKITNTYALNCSDGAINKTSVEMRDPTFVAALGSAFFEDDKPWTRNNGYPILGYEPLITDICIIEDMQTVEVTTDEQFKVRPQKIIIKDGGSLKNSTTNEFSNVIVERTLADESYVFIGSAFGDITAGTYLGEHGEPHTYSNVENHYPVSILNFNYTSNMWSDGNSGGFHYLKCDSVIKKGLGYFAYVLDPNYSQDINWLKENRGKKITLTFNADMTKSINNTGIDITLTNDGEEHTCESTTDGLWYALSNPFSCNLYAKRFLSKNTNVQGNVIYTLNGETRLWEEKLGSDNDARIKIGEGFFVAGKNGMASKTQTFQLSNLMTDPISAKKTDERPEIKIIAVANNLQSRAYITVNENSSNGFDENDAYKMFGNNENAVEPYFSVEGQELLKNSIKTLPYETKLKFATKQDNTDLTLTFENIPSDINVILSDLYFGSVDTIKEGFMKKFNISTMDKEDRFVIRLEKYDNSLKHENKEDLNIWAFNNKLTMTGTDLQTLEIFNSIGQSVFNVEITSNTYSIFVNQPTGSYIARLKSKNGIKIIKFIIDN